MPRDESDIQPANGTGTDMTVEELLERVSDQLARAEFTIADAMEDLRIVSPSVFVLDRLGHIQQDLILLRTFVPGLAPARLR